MSNANLGWLYYKKLYANGDDTQHIKNTFEKILKLNAKDESLNLEQSFTLTTTYPGLIIGSGYAHGISNEEDSKVGFYFDHTSGLPIIPGSSIKGVLRSFFQEQYKEEKQEFIQELLKKEVNVEKLAEAIFEGQRDKFYEARIIKTSGAILQEDYITPHKNPLKNPIPIKIVKIAGGVTFEFSFELHDTTIDETTITADEKLKLFFQLLQFSGVGAKTNVGYGQFKEKSITHLETKQKERQQEKEKELQEAKKAKEAKALQEALNNADTIVKKIKIQTKELEPKEIFDLLQTYELSEQEKQELLSFMETKIGVMPEDTPKNMKKAKTKWPLKIYKLLGR